MKSRIGSFFSRPKKIGQVEKPSQRGQSPKSNDGGFVYNMMKPLAKLFPEGAAVNPLNLGGKIRFNWCGPFNSMDESRPITNRTDGVCKQHDFAYEAVMAAPKEQQKGMFRDADQMMMNRLGAIDEFQDMNEQLGYHIARYAIGMKMRAEDFIGQFSSE